MCFIQQRGFHQSHIQASPKQGGQEKSCKKNASSCAGGEGDSVATVQQPVQKDNGVLLPPTPEKQQGITVQSGICRSSTAFRGISVLHCWVPKMHQPPRLCAKGGRT